MTETPDFDLESGKDCAKMYRQLRDRAEDMGFATVTEALDELEFGRVSDAVNKLGDSK